MRVLLGVPLFALVGALMAQEEVPVRRAEPVQHSEDATPVLRALPVEEQPAPTPAPVAEPEPIVPTLVTPPGQLSSPDQVLLEYANGLFARKIYDMAAPEYEKFLKLYPLSRDRQMALFRLGECYRARNVLNGAKQAYENLLATFGTGEFVGPAAYRIADIYYQQENYQSALPFFRKASALLKEPNIVTAARFYTGRCLELQGRSYEARSVYEDVIQANSNPAFVEASRLSLAQLLSSASLKKEALKQFDLLAKTTQKPALKAEALVRAGMLRIELKDAAAARANLDAALAIPEIGSMKEVAEIGLLKILFETERHKEFLAKYPAALEALSPEARAEVLMLAANVHRQLSQNAQARDIYLQVSREHPGTEHDKNARYELLMTLYHTNDPGLVEAADKYLSDFPDSPKGDQVLLLKAETLFKRKDYVAALPVYQAFEASGLPERLKQEALFRLGWCFQQTKEPRKAIASFTSFLAASGTHKLAPSALAQRAVAFQQTKDFTAALKDFEAILSRFPKAPERELALQQKALILGQQQDNAGMARAFELLLKEFPKTPAAAQANYWIGWAAFEAKDYKRALAPLERARSLDPEQFSERATLRIMLSQYYLEQKQALATEVDRYSSSNSKGKVPAEILRWLGAEFYKAAQFKAAEQYLGILTGRVDEVTANDWLDLGRAQAEQQLYGKATASLETYLRMVEEPFAKATGLLALSQVQLGMREFEAARKSAEQACALQPEGKLNAQGRILLGDIAASRGDYEEAARTYMGVSVVFDDPQITPKALEKATRAYQKSGKAPEAAKIINTLQSRYPEYPFTP